VELSSGQNAVALAIDASNVYWASIDKYVVDSTSYYNYANIRWMAKSGGTTQLLAHTRSNNVRSIVTRDDGVLWSAGTCNPCDYPGADRDWGLFTGDASKADGYRTLTTFTIPIGAQPPIVAANALKAFAVAPNWDTGRWDVLSCDRDREGSCKRLEADAPLVPPVYHEGDRLYFVEQPTDTDMGVRSLLCAIRDDGAHDGCLNLQNVQGIDGLRVNGTVFALRARGAVWTGSLPADGSRPLTRIWNAPNGREVDISQGRVYWTQDRTGQYPGCIGSANLDGTDAFCVDQGDHTYAGVRVDDSAVYFIRDGNVVRVAK